MIAPACPIVFPGGAVKPAMYATTGFVISDSDEVGRLLLLVAADLADHHDVLGLGVVLEHPEDVDERGADDGVSADADDRRVAEPHLRQLVTDLVGERARAGDEADRALGEDLGRDDPDVRLPGRQRAGAVRAESADALGARVPVDAEHLVRGDALGDRDHRVDAGVDRLVDRVRGERRGHEDHRRVRAVLDDRLDDRVEHRHALDVLPALPRRDPATRFVPYARFRRPWKRPSDPVRPWTTSRVSLSTRMAISGP